MASIIARAGLIVGLFAMLLPCADAADRLLEQPARLRISWGGQEPRRWSGQIAVEAGAFSELQLLGLDADAPGSIWIDDGVIHVNSINPHRFDGCDVTVSAGESARLVIDLSADGMAESAKLDVPLSEAVRADARQPVRQPLIGPDATLLVHRSPNDSLRIETDRQTLIFAPGETFTFKIRPVLDELLPSTTVDVLATLSSARTGERLGNDESQRLPVPANGQPEATINLVVPTEEGVFDVRVGVSQSPGVRKAFFPIGGSRPIAERTFQIVVVRPAPNPTTDSTPWQSVLEIDPANPRWYQSFPKWTQLQRLPGLTPRPLGSLRAGTVNHALGQFVELPPTPGEGEPHWQAYVLPLEQTGVPHLLEVEYPADQEQHFGLSIVEPNAAGRVVPVGRDSGVYVEGLGRAESTSRHTHRLVFWPRTNSPLLLVANLHPTAAAHFGRIRVRRGPVSLAGSIERRSWQESSRLVAVYMARPLLPEVFGATEGRDPATGESADDFQTFHEASQRFADYMRFAGYNAAVLNVLSDGSSIYPSRRLQPTPLYETSRSAAGSADLPPTDPLEIILREFDREGLALVPSLQLAAPLPELEELRRMSDPRTSGLEWVNGDGRTWVEEFGTDRGLAPYYNLLDERVQQAVLAVTGELLERYAHHASLAGLAVQLSGNGYAQLPDSGWGLDDETFAAFERAAGIRLADSGPNRFAARQAAVLGEHAAAWRTWRASRVTEFYRRLAQQLQLTGAERRLFLTTEGMFTAPRLQSQLHPNILTRLRPESLMQESGIDRTQLEQIRGVTVCAARFVAPIAPLADRAVDIEINQAAAQAAPADSAMLFHRPQRRRLASFDAKSSLNSYTLLVTQSSADAAGARKQLAEVLAASDPSLVMTGGELVPMGQEEATRAVFRVLQQLPVRADATVLRQQPVTVRSYAETNSTTHVIVNECPWAVDLQMAFDVPAQTELERLTAPPTSEGGAETVRHRLAAGRQTWALRLEPYAIEVVRASVPSLNVAEIQTSIGEAAKAELQTRLADLAGRDLTAPSKYSKLSNPGFEPAGGGSPLPGWRLVNAAGNATAELDGTKPVSGKSCLLLQSRGDTVCVESDTFSSPLTGQLLMAVWVRGENLAPGSELRMVFEADRAGQPYRTYWALGGNRASAQPLLPDWGRPFAVGVNDLPLDSKGRMRVRFELTGAGEVWIDEVQLYDVLFPLPYYKYTQEERLEIVKLIDKANKEFEGNRLSDCVRSLEGYWPRFLIEYMPPVDPAIVKDAPPPNSPVEAPPAAKEKPAPGISDRFRQWWNWR